MAIQHAFKQAETNRVSQQNQGIGTITQGLKSASTMVGGALAGIGMSGGSTGALSKFSESAVGRMTFQNMAGKIGGIGGNLLAQQMTEKFTSAETAQQNKSSISTSTFAKIEKELSGNPINNKAIKQIRTVYDTMVLERGRQQLESAKTKLKNEEDTE